MQQDIPLFHENAWKANRRNFGRFLKPEYEVPYLAAFILSIGKKNKAIPLFMIKS